ncbi:MAG: Hint domain-containing protein [Pseudomonadota bacterium]
MTVHPRTHRARRAFYSDLTVQPGLPGKTRILTMSGAIPIHSLQAGERIITRETGATKLLGMESLTRLTDLVAFHRLAVEGAGGLVTTILPAEQPVFLRDWRAQALFGAEQALVAAHRLVDEEFVTRRVPQNMDLFHLYFDTPQIVYVEGMELGAGSPAQPSTKARA